MKYVGKNLDNPNHSIDLWFPKSVFKVNEFELENIEKYIIYIKNICNGSILIKSNIFEIGSTHLTNNKIHKLPEFKDLAEKITEKIRIYAEEHGYNKETVNRFSIVDMWINISNEGDFLHSHIHQNSLFSGVFYVKSTAKSKIFFHDFTDYFFAPESYTDLSYNLATYDCISGLLLIWKSNIPHSTSKQQDVEKISISFNVNLK